MKRIAAVLLAFAGLVFTGVAWGQAAEVPNANPETERRLKHLAEELRCLVCQNQTIADSNAALAVDLRNQIRGQIAAGRDDTQIRDYMVQRYGDFVLYRPPFKATTALLWLGPVVLLVFGAVIYALTVRRRKSLPDAPAPAAKRRAEIEKLLQD
jgi:cytochrome c-type biogenesis protein CcmH/NrfF